MEGRKEFLQPPEISQYTVNVTIGRQLIPLFYKDMCTDFPMAKWTWPDMLTTVQKHRFIPRQVRNA